MYHIIIKRFDEPKSGTPSTIHHQNKKIISALKIEILIKDKRIKWTPTRKVRLRTYSQGDNIFTVYKVILTFLSLQHLDHFLKPFQD